jgi:hypothetical protein
MAKVIITEDFLANQVWWWREGCAKHPVDFMRNPVTLKSGPLLPIYKLAFNYELATRGDRSKRLGSFTELGQSHLWIIAPTMGPPYLIQLASRDAGNEAQGNEKGWTPLRPMFQWNLRESDRTLMKAFKALIQDQRRVEGIAAPRGHQRTRPISWRWLELMDLADFKIDYVMSDGERSSLSSARKAAKRQSKIFEAAIDEYWESHKMAEWFENGDEDEDQHETPLDFPPWFCQTAITPKPLYRDIWPQNE